MRVSQREKERESVREKEKVINLLLLKPCSVHVSNLNKRCRIVLTIIFKSKKYGIHINMFICECYKKKV